MKENNKITGTIDIKRNGHAYLVQEEGDKGGIFIHKSKLGKALHNDTVCIELLKGGEIGIDEVQGQVTKVSKRHQDEFSGVLDINKEKNIAFVRTSGGNMRVDIYVPRERLNGAKNGEVVIVRLSGWNKKDKSPHGAVIRSLGKAQTHETEMGNIMFKHGIDYTFPKEVEAEAHLISEVISEKEINSRRDMRDTLTITIDPESAKDFDDAISFKEKDNGNYEIGIHIADVAHYIRPGSELDKEAYNRATSVYLVDRCIPMLPERLSNGICSLRPNEDKLCFSVILEMNSEGKVVKHNFRKTVINSDARLSYEEAQEIIEGKEVNVSWVPGIGVQHCVKTLNDIAKKVRKKRFKNGAVTFNRREPQFVLNEEGTPTDVFFSEAHEAHQLIEEYMLLANRYVAKHVHALTKTYIYRTHDLPSEEKLQELSKFVEQFGYDFNTSGNIEQTKASLNAMLKKASGTAEEGMISTLSIRSMSKAEYSTKVIGHYGLGFKHYSHFTSPIRRYPDVIAHRLLWEYIKGKNGNISKLGDQCEHCSDMENRAAKAQRESIKYKQCEFLKEKVGEQFTGVISSVTDFGIFVEILENGCEGLVGKDTLLNEELHVDVENFCVNNLNNGDTYRLGDEVTIQVNRVDMARKRIDFKIIL